LLILRIPSVLIVFSMGQDVEDFDDFGVIGV